MHNLWNSTVIIKLQLEMTNFMPIYNNVNVNQLLKVEIQKKKNHFSFESLKALFEVHSYLKRMALQREKGWSVQTNHNIYPTIYHSYIKGKI